MAEANLIPGATQVFADVLEGGDVKKLFDNMQKGKYTAIDILHVLSELKKKIKQDQIDEMLKRPTAELAELTTAWVRFLEVFNKNAGLALMKGFLDEMTGALNWGKQLLIDNEQELKAFGKGVGAVWRWLKLTVVVAKDVLATLAPIAPALFSALGGGLLGVLFKPFLTVVKGKVVPATEGLLGKINLLSKAMGGLLLRFLILPIMVAVGLGLLIELFDTMSGKDTMWTRLAEQKDKGILGWLAAVTKSVTDLMVLTAKGIVAGVHWAFGDDEDKKMAEDFLKESVDQYVASNERMGFGGIGDSLGSKFKENTARNASTLGSIFTGEGTNQQMRYLGQPAPTTPTIITNAPILHISVSGSDPVEAQEIVTRALNESYMMIQQRETSNYQKDALNFPFVGG
jgi:hypothetical protein